MDPSPRAAAKSAPPGRTATATRKPGAAFGGPARVARRETAQKLPPNCLCVSVVRSAVYEYNYLLILTANRHRAQILPSENCLFPEGCALDLGLCVIGQGDNQQRAARIIFLSSELRGFAPSREIRDLGPTGPLPPESPPGKPARPDNSAARPARPGPHAMSTSESRGPEQLCKTGPLLIIYLLQNLPDPGLQNRHIKLCGLPDLFDVNSKVLMHENVS
jgi:hypothetical protein